MANAFKSVAIKFKSQHETAHTLCEEIERKDEEFSDLKRKYDEAASVLQSSQQEVREDRRCAVRDALDGDSSVCLYYCIRYVATRW